MNVPRLQHLLTVLENISPEKFDLENWTAHETPCGTVACACGWAAMDLEFQEQGLYLSAGIPALRVGDRRLASWPAVEHCFGLTYQEAQYLFADEAYGGHPAENSYVGSGTTTADVIARIRELLRGNTK